MNPRVTIIEDDKGTRETLAALIENNSGFHCVGTHESAESALKALASEQPQILLLDLELPQMSGEEFILKVRRRQPNIEILVLTIQDEPRRIFAALEAGATGYLVKPVPPAKILDALREVISGGSPMSGPIARLVIQHFHHRRSDQTALATLTGREEEILGLLAKGYRYREIAGQLGISVRTVSTHLHHIYEKLHVRSATEAAAKYRG
jgi:DNA-binding NarL/FixJ family response regulator